MGNPAADQWVRDTFGIDLSRDAPTPNLVPSPGVLTGALDAASAAAPNAKPMDEAWIVSFLTRHHFGAAPDANAAADACLFDGAASTVADVLQVLDAEAQTDGRSLNAAREDIVRDVLAQHQRGAAMGQMLAKHMKADDDIGLYLAGLQRQKMVAILDALEAVRGAKQLDTLLDMVRNILRDQRLEVAILTVQHHVGGEWRSLMDGLKDDADSAAIRTHLFNSIESGDQGDLKPIVHGDQAYKNDASDDKAWLDGFLKFVNARPDSGDDGSGKTCIFDGIPLPFQRAVDETLEQAGLAGRMLDDGDVANALAKLVVQPRPAKPGERPAPQYSIQYAFVPTGAHLSTQGKGTLDPPQSQVSYTGTIALHPDGASGPEIAWTVQVAATAKTFVVQNILQGPQAQWVWPFLNNTLQVQVIAQALRGMANGGTDAKGAVAMVPMTQIGIAGQVTYAIFGKSVLIGFQLSATGTATDGQAPTADLVPQGFIQVQWN
jgi:hypothetical protein